MRVGQGFDIHALVAGRKLIVGGVEIAHELGLAGHSDADVLLHAICDALIGASGLGDIGTHFPDDDVRFRGIDSRELLRSVGYMVNNRGLRIANIDSTIIAQAPKMAPHISQMRGNIAQDLGLDVDQVNVKAKTAERLGALGREEGIAAQAIVLLVTPAGD
jgi:2-C-methyl-D-erythritol 2,4-cyclodiphosphate synthase